jgi:hypothetical protein
MSPETAASNLPIIHLHYDNGKNMDYWLSDTDHIGIEELKRKCVPLPLSLPQLQNGLSW